MAKEGIVTERDAYQYGKALIYLKNKRHASKTSIHDYVGLTYDQSRVLIENLLDKGLIEPVKVSARHYFELTDKGSSAATLYEKWMRAVGAK
jgi:predicted transcriptional regulator